MAGTFSQIYIQVVFAVKGRDNLINRHWKDDLHKYIAGIIKGKKQKSIIVNGMPDHIHAFIGLKPSMAISDLVRDIKNNSSNFILFFGLIPRSSTAHLFFCALALLIPRSSAAGSFINDKKFVKGKFSWQDGYGAFSYSHSQIDTVYQYVVNQEIHHQKKTFRDEYLDFLKRFEIEYDEKFLFDWLNY